VARRKATPKQGRARRRRLAAAGRALFACGLSLAATAFSVPVSAQPLPGDGGGSLEWAVKATYLYKFVPFIEWPPSAFESPASPIGLCVVGDDPFGGVLDKAVSGQRFGEHPLTVKRLQSVDRQSGCHVLYVWRSTGGGAQSVTDMLDAVRGTPVLTVTDSVRDAPAKGIVNFVLDNNRVRFEIDNQAAAENGLAISSKLLSLAVYVRPRS
jgi:hypothetical protein